ncbi:MAG: response regulator [Chloroflexi bacterium]|nr:response regulator [Chloroflexota bacterium]
MMIEVDQRTFAGYVRDALAHLHDRPSLQGHPLVGLLPELGQKPSADAVHRLLLEAISQLRPLGPVPGHSPEARRHRYLSLRYVDGVAPQRIARDLGLSERQARRLHQEALEVVASLLWERCRDRGRSGDAPTIVTTPDALVPSVSSPPPRGQQGTAAPAVPDWARIGLGSQPALSPAKGTAAELAPIEERGGEVRPLAREGAETQAAEDASDQTRGNEPGDGEVGVEAELTRLTIDRGKGRADLSETLDSVRQTIAMLIARQAGRLERSLPPDLPPVALGRTILRQILLIFLTSALQAGRGHRVRITAAVDGQEVLVDIVSDDLQPGQAASRPEPARQDAEALLETGVRLIQMHCGTVEHLPAAMGAPSGFRVRLPALQPATVLVVDDNPGVARLFRRYLQGTGYRVVEASTGQGAVALAQQVRPDAVILDVLLPSQDGWEILQQLRGDEITRDIPVIVCSILHERALALALGVTDFLPKPVSRTSLLAALGRCLGVETAERPDSP